MEKMLIGSLRDTVELSYGNDSIRFHSTDVDTEWGEGITPGEDFIISIDREHDYPYKLNREEMSRFAHRLLQLIGEEAPSPILHIGQEEFDRKVREVYPTATADTFNEMVRYRWGREGSPKYSWFDVAKYNITRQSGFIMER